MKRVVATFAAAAALVASVGLTASASSAAPSAPSAPSAPTVDTAAERAGVAAYEPPPIKWSKCADPDYVSAGLQCGYLTVPLDYANSGGTKIQLAVSRKLHTSSSADYQGVMLVNPGGPGGSGTVYPVLQTAVPKKAGGFYDWIGFDPRGVGNSIPALSCDPKILAYNRPRYEPISSAVESAWGAKAKAYAKACDTKGGALLDHARTIDTVKDMEIIRKALGRTQINFYGFSYGTYLAQTYAQVYPGKVRRMVMDGVVDPKRAWYRANLDQNQAFEKTINVYFGWVAKYDSVYHLGTTAAAVSDKYYAQLDKLTATPAGGKVGPSEWADVFLSAGYYVYGWEDVASAFSAAVNSNQYKPILDLYGYGKNGGDDNGLAMYLATTCTDSGWPKDLATFRADNAKSYTTAKFLTWGNAWFNAPCRFWGAKNGKLTDITGNSTKMLLISETLDPATPYSGAIEVRKRFTKSALIEGVGGTTHAGSLSGVTCTDNAIADFLTSGHLPKRKAGDVSDLQCAPVPQPDPTAPAAAAKAGPLSRAALQPGLVGPAARL